MHEACIVNRAKCNNSVSLADLKLQRHNNALHCVDGGMSAHAHHAFKQQSQRRQPAAAADSYFALPEASEILCQDGNIVFFETEIANDGCNLQDPLPGQLMGAAFPTACENARIVSFVDFLSNALH